MADISSNVAAAMAAAPTTSQKAATVATEAPVAAKVATKVDQTPPPAKEPAKGVEPAKEAARKHKLKVDNEEVEVDDDELKRGYAHNKAASKRFEEAAAVRKQAEEAFAMLKDPAQLRKLLEDPRVGVDFRKLAEEFLWDKYQEEALTPEQKKQKDIERELDKYRASEKEAKERAEVQEAERLQNQYAAEYEQKILNALEQSDVPKTRATVRRMAHYLQLAIANDIDVSPADLVSRVRQDLIEEHRSMYSAADGSALRSLLGDDLVSKLREADLKRLKSTQPENHRKVASTPKSPAKPMEKRREVMSADKLREVLTEKLKG